MVKSDYSTYRLVLRLLAMMKHLLAWIALAVVFAVLGFMLTVSIPTILAYLGLEVMAGHAIDLKWLYLFIAMALLRGLFRYGEHYFGHFVAFHSLAAFRRIVFKKLRALSPARLDSQDSGHLLKMIGEDIEALEVFFAHTLAPICTALVSASLMVYWFLQVSWKLALGAIVTYVLLAVIIPVYFSNVLQSLLKKQNEGRRTYVSSFLESLRSVKDLLQFQSIEKRFKLLSNQSKHVNALDRQVAQAQFLQMAITFLALGLSILTFAYVTLFELSQQTVTFAGGLLAFVAFTASFAPFLELGRLPLGFKRAMNAARNVFQLLDEEALVDKGDQRISSVTRIAIEDLTFAYPKHQETVYHHLSVAFEKKGIIGIQGESGSGKSTLMKVIMKWYGWQSGHIFLSEVDSQLLNAASLQANFAYVPQNAQLFQQTLRDNITLGRKDISDDDIMELAEACGMKERILACAEGLDTLVTGSADFSAGEAQRLELMRALLKRVDCYIFDEPTSNLDSLNEAIFIDLIKKHCRGMVFLISHRPSTLACADQLFCVRNGFLKEVNNERVNH
ncbi:TPA: ABC transporter ATP-binding protein [Streptococcus equi subsp. zooepidemicus]|uniref:ABC transporter ATP-binding protein n=1 Tax=Streptococcus equi TaxID=1336 RepID=UPI001E33ABC5|nr:ABC transporter ATP-binding protein [Streptococcus equi]MCD3459016.1 ABC transporter ATP-binding protein/permease [Streptococcus equi subsp. zooepidemicus]MDI5901855.1 ABC transporter ATP-binding protein [Streptococcus equi subsp. zooepidemicus]MDI5930584.1 ABC transporter ATP-binding protein [Streptococcus equi subsp. zooepidemicus]MDI6029940.1 ABC transporter ATP-binding protein [Streptococcus equi subsp. zooepidemicus]HEL0776008.1 ABC transporter ATP-binding protein [Streptococcus equi s